MELSLSGHDCPIDDQFVFSTNSLNKLPFLSRDIFKAVSVWASLPNWWNNKTGSVHLHKTYRLGNHAQLTKYQDSSICSFKELPLSSPPWNRIFEFATGLVKNGTITPSHCGLLPPPHSQGFERLDFFEDKYSKCIEHLLWTKKHYASQFHGFEKFSQTSWFLLRSTEEKRL